MRTIKIDGVEYKVEDKVAEYLKAATERADAAELTATEATTEADKARARADAADAEKVKLEKERNDAADPAKLQAAIRSRVDLERKAVIVLGADAKLDSLADVDVKKAVVAKKMPDMKLDGQSADYIGALFDLAVTQADKATPHLDAARRVADPIAPQGETKNDAGDDAEAARMRLVKFGQEAYRTLGKK